MKIIHTVGTLSLECEIQETEPEPDLVDNDEENLFINTVSCEYFLLRRKIYNMLKVAKAALPEGYHFKAFELYRPMKTQIYYWECVLHDLRDQYPNLSEAELEERANVFIANPYKQGSGHQTGGAIDLTLCDATGKEVDMGTKWREFNELTATFPMSEKLTAEQKKNRKILYDAMIIAGFVNYFEEWWHFSYGEIEWAVITHIGRTLFAPLKI